MGGKIQGSGVCGHLVINPVSRSIIEFSSPMIRLSAFNQGLLRPLTKRLVQASRHTSHSDHFSVKRFSLFSDMAFVFHSAVIFEELPKSAVHFISCIEMIEGKRSVPLGIGFGPVRKQAQCIPTRVIMP